MGSLKDSDLFTVNTGADRLHEKRAALSADRFKAKEKSSLKSKTEQALIKKLQSKGPVQAHKVDNPDELANLWATPLNETKARASFREFTNKSVPKVKALIVPVSG